MKPRQLCVRRQRLFRHWRVVLFGSLISTHRMMAPIISNRLEYSQRRKIINSDHAPINRFSKLNCPIHAADPAPDRAQPSRPHFSEQVSAHGNHDGRQRSARKTANNTHQCNGDIRVSRNATKPIEIIKQRRCVKPQRRTDVVMCIFP